MSAARSRNIIRVFIASAERIRDSFSLGSGVSRTMREDLRKQVKYARIGRMAWSPRNAVQAGSRSRGEHDCDNNDDDDGTDDNDNGYDDDDEKEDGPGRTGPDFRVKGEAAPACNAPEKARSPRGNEKSQCSEKTRRARLERRKGSSW